MARSRRSDTFLVVLTFADPADVDLPYAAEVAALADRFATEPIGTEAVHDLLSGRDVRAVTQTLRVLGAALLARFTTSSEATGVDVARAAGRIVTGLFNAADLDEEIMTVGVLIAADMTPHDPEVLRAAMAMRSEMLVTGLVLWVLALAVTVSYFTDEHLPGGESLRWVIGVAQDPDPLARIVISM